MSDDLKRRRIIAAAKREHDRVCNCAPKYLMSCSNMARAIQDVGLSVMAEIDSEEGHPR